MINWMCIITTDDPVLLSPLNKTLMTSPLMILPKVVYESIASSNEKANCYDDGLI